MATLPKHLTLEEFLALPEEKPALEYIDGKVTQKVPPLGMHAVLQVGLCALFNRSGMPGKLWIALSELRTTYAGQSRVPDVAVYLWERIPRGERGRVGDDFFVPPDVAIEIISPGQRVNQMVERCVWFVANG